MTLTNPSFADRVSSILPIRMIANDIVRREKALDFSGWNSRPGTGSLHPVAIEAAVEVTKLLKPSMERVVSAIQRARRP
jgi:hypothetical protein